MKVMQIMGGNGDGGLEKHVIELSNAMSEYCSVVVVAHPKYQAYFNDLVIFEPLDLAKSRRNLVVLYRLLNLIKKHQPSVVHAQANKAGLMVASIRTFFDSKAVVTIHNLKKNLSFLKRFNLALGVSRGVTEQFPSVVAKKTVYNGIPKPLVTDKELLFDDCGKPAVVSVGRLVPAKGFDVLLSAWEGIDAHLYIVGDGPDRDMLEKQIQTSKHLSNHVTLLGHRTDVPNIIAASDLVVISSRREGFSYVFSESLLLNKPILSTDVPIPNEILPEKYLCDAENAEALRSLINKGLSDMSELNSSFSEIFEYANQHLQIETMVEQTLVAYASVCK